MKPGQCSAMLAHERADADLSLALLMMNIVSAIDQCAALLLRVRPSEADSASARQAMLDCIERARQPVGVPA